MEQQQEIENIISAGGVDYEDFPVGETVCGLCLIKIKERDVWKDGVKQEGKREKVYQFSFRSAHNPKAWLHVRCTPKWNDKATLYQVLRAMTNKKLKLTTPMPEVFATMKTLVGQWFAVECKKSDFGKGMTLTTKDAISPMAGPDGKDCIKFFQELDGETKSFG